jgi:hypothetical protein
MALVGGFPVPVPQNQLLPEEEAADGDGFFVASLDGSQGRERTEKFQGDSANSNCDYFLLVSPA